MKTADPINEIQTETPAEITHPATDSLSRLFKQVREDASQGASEYLQDTLVSEGGE